MDELYNTSLDQNPIENSCCYYTPNNFPSFSVTEDFNSKPNSNNVFSLLHVNSRSLSKNFDSLQTLLSTLNLPISIIGITEILLHSNSHPLFDLNNYQTIRADRSGRRLISIDTFTKHFI